MMWRTLLGLALLAVSACEMIPGHLGSNDSVWRDTVAGVVAEMAATQCPPANCTVLVKAPEKGPADPIMRDAVIDAFRRAGIGIATVAESPKEQAGKDDAATPITQVSYRLYGRSDGVVVRVDINGLTLTRFLGPQINGQMDKSSAMTVKH